MGSSLSVVTVIDESTQSTVVQSSIKGEKEHKSSREEEKNAFSSLTVPRVFFTRISKCHG